MIAKREWMSKAQTIFRSQMVEMCVVFEEVGYNNTSFLLHTTVTCNLCIHPSKQTVVSSWQHSHAVKKSADASIEE